MCYLDVEGAYRYSKFRYVSPLYELPGLVRPMTPVFDFGLPIPQHSGAMYLDDPSILVIALYTRKLHIGEVRRRSRYLNMCSLSYEEESVYEENSNPGSSAGLWGSCLSDP
jgi:hypothetical protein